VIGSDPVRTGLVASLNRPGGNVTGVTFTTVDVTAKRLGQLHELVPKAEVIGVLLDPNNPEVDLQLRDVEVAAQTIGRRALVVKATRPSEFNAAFATLVQAGSAPCSSAAVRSSPPSVNGWLCCPRDMRFPRATRSASLRWRAA